MTSIRLTLALFLVVTACGDDGTNRLPDAPNSDAATDATIDAPDEVMLTISLAGNGTGEVTSDPAGLTCGATCSAGFPQDTVVTLTAAPALGSVFGGWSGGACSGTAATCEVTLATASSVTATFELATYTVTLSKIGAGSGTVTGNGIACGATCTATIEHGTTITLSAAPASLSTFAGWGGPCSNTGTCVATITADTTITAAFSLDDLTLMVTRAGSGTGTVTSSPAGISCGADCSETYTAGQVVTLSAAAGGGSTFTGWSGGGCTGTGTCIVTMTAATTVTATFTLNSYMLTVARNGNGAGTVTSNPAGISCGADCTQPYNHGTVVTLTAAPTVGNAATSSVFTGWSGGGCTGTGTCAVTLTAATTVTATFSLAPNVMFVTSTLHTGALGNIAGADGICQSRAQAAGLVGQNPGQNTTFLAWLSSSAINASARFPTATGWARPDGRAVFNTVADIAQHKFFYPPRLTESGADVGAAQRVWTGTNAAGTYAGAECPGGTLAVFPWNNGTSGTGWSGLASGDSAMFTDFLQYSCTLTARLYCMGTDRAATVTAPAQTGRLAFTSATSFVPDATGLAKADGICQTDATNAGLSGTFRALLATDTASAISRFNTAGAPWIRVGDRQRITVTAAALAGATLATIDVAPNATAAGTRLGNVGLWTGAVNPGTVGTTGNTCSNWTSASGKGYGGRAGDTGVTSYWFGADPGLTCSTSGRRLICLQN